MNAGTVLVVTLVLMVLVGAIKSLVRFNKLQPRDKAGPDKRWQWGKLDPMRWIFFHQDGSLRQFSRLALSVWMIAIIILGVVALYDLIWRAG